MLLTPLTSVLAANGAKVFNANPIDLFSAESNGELSSLLAEYDASESQAVRDAILDAIEADVFEKINDGDSLNFPYRVNGVEIVAGSRIFDGSRLTLSVKSLTPIRLRLVNRYTNYAFPGSEWDTYMCPLDNLCYVTIKSQEAN